MSLKNAKAFIKKVGEDKELEAKFRAIDKNPKANWEKRMTTLIDLAAAAGFEFTPIEFSTEKARRNIGKTIKAFKDQGSHIKPLGSKSKDMARSSKAVSRCYLCETPDENTTGNCINCDTYCQNNHQSKSKDMASASKAVSRCWQCDTSSENTTGNCWVCDTTCQAGGSKKSWP